MTPTPIIHPHSFLGHLATQQPLLTSAGNELARMVPCQLGNEQAGGKMSTQAVLVSLDNGNDALKGAMLHAREPTLRTRRIVTAYALARTIRAGEGVTTWQVNESEPFWIGEDAVFTNKAESLPIGMTEERLADPRFRYFLCACLVELLIEAGYALRPGERQVLTSGAVTVEGRRVRIDEVVAEVINARSQNLFTQLLPLLQERQSFVMFTGGSLLLSHSLRRLVSTKRSLHSVLFVPDEFAPVLNAIGGYVLAQASAQRLVERPSAADPSQRRRYE